MYRRGRKLVIELLLVICSATLAGAQQPAITQYVSFSSD